MASLPWPWPWPAQGLTDPVNPEKPAMPPHEASIANPEPETMIMKTTVKSTLPPGLRGFRGFWSVTLPLLLGFCMVLAVVSGAHAQTGPAAPKDEPAEIFEPTIGQRGKDVVWVPTESSLVTTMLDMAMVTPEDYLIDLGSGDGRTVIAAALRGLRAHGIEYNPDLVALSLQRAREAGVAERATFEKADIFESDFSEATVITLFLLQSLNERLRPTLLEMRPGTRIVSNTFTMAEWEPDERRTIDDCTTWCTALLWIVPARVNGRWRLESQSGERGGASTLQLTQSFQMLEGSLNGAALADARLEGAEIAFTVDGRHYQGRVEGERMSGRTADGTPWQALRLEK